MQTWHHVLRKPQLRTKEIKGLRAPTPFYCLSRAELQQALLAWRAITVPLGPIITSERGGRMRAGSIVLWFARAFRAIGLHGCSSHSGRRTFITRAARLVHKTGGSLRDVQLLAGHASITTTQRYIDGDTDAQRKLVSLI